MTAILLLAPVAHAQAPNSVFLEDFTSPEIKDMVKAGTTSIIVATGGTEQNGPHMILGKHNYILKYTTDKIARSRGKTLVAPIIAYVPEGDWDNPRGHMTKAGTISLPNEKGFTELLDHTVRSLQKSGFKNIILLGDSGGNQAGMKEVADKINKEWTGSGNRVLYIPDYYTKSHADQEKYITDKLGIPKEKIGGHANMVDTSEVIFLNAAWIRKDKIAPGDSQPDSGVNGDPTKATPELGQTFLKIKVENALAQIKQLMQNAPAPVATTVSLTTMARPAQTPGTTSKSVFIEDLTWAEVRDAIAGGKTAVIIGTGGTEQNGPHMVTGKHNFVIRRTAEMMAQRLGNALVAPVLQYVPEGDYRSETFADKPGVISCPDPTYVKILEAAARSLKVHGFKDILFIGDSGGNQQGFTVVANKLNKEWEGSGVRVFAVRDYYEASRQHLRAWLLAQYAYDEQTVGSHAGITDTSQIMYIRPEGIRRNMIKPFGGGPDAGVSGDPTKATPEIGKMALEFKVNSGIQQYKTLKNPPQRGGRGSGPGR